jgi:hypothetical protein
MRAKLAACEDGRNDRGPKLTKLCNYLKSSSRAYLDFFLVIFLTCVQKLEGTVAG